MRRLRFGIGFRGFRVRIRRDFGLEGLPLPRAVALGASVAWLAVGSVYGLEGFGIPAFVEWRPLAFIVFLAINAFAAGVVVSELAVAARPRLARHRFMLLQAVAAALLFVSVMAYLEFMQTHAVTARAY